MLENEIELIKTLIQKVSSTYNIPEQEILDSIRFPSESIDVCIFSNMKLSPTEVLVKYFHENKFKKFSEIASMLKRNQNTIQTTYNNSKRKHPQNLRFYTTGVKVPLFIFQTKRFTVLESLVKYLKEQKNMTNNEIAKLIKKSNKTIWTVYDRVKNKG